MLQKEINKKGKVFTHNNINITQYASECYRVLKDGSHFYIMTNHVNLINMLNTCTSVGFHFVKSLVWNKGNKIMGQFYMSQFEYILFFRKGKGVKINNCGTSDILNIPNKKTKDENGKLDSSDLIRLFSTHVNGQQLNEHQIANDKQEYDQLKQENEQLKQQLLMHEMRINELKMQLDYVKANEQWLKQQVDQKLIEHKQPERKGLLGKLFG
jgi:DNA modification methylase